jgi:hypothetical protein
MFKGTDVALNTAVNITATGTALRLANSDQNTAVTVNAVAHKTTDINSAVTVNSTVTAIPLVVRLVAANASMIASAEITAVKRTDIVSSVDVSTAISATGRGIFDAQAQFAAIASNLTVAFNNATGTVLLESAFGMQTTAEKNAVGVIEIAGAFTQSTDTADAKTVRVSSAIAAEFTQVAEGQRIQPAGADVSAQFTQTTNSDLSKITRVNAALATAVAITAIAERTRSTPTSMPAVTSIVCDNVVLRRASANLVDTFDLLISVQYIIRITAEFTAFNSQLTVGEIINIDPFLQLKIEPETRINKIPQESRVFIIESETRVNIIKD